MEGQRTSGRPRPAVNAVSRCPAWRAGLLYGLVGALLALHGALFALLVPPWDLNDEEQHFDYVRILAEQHRLPRLGRDLIAPEILDSARATDRWRRFHLPPQDPGGPADIGLEGLSYEAYHPPLYYALLVPAYLATGGSILDRLLAIRLETVGLAVVSGLLGLALLRRLFPGRPLVSTAAAVLLTLAPERALATSRVSNDIVPDLAVTLALLVLAAWWAKPVNIRRAVTCGLLVGLAALGKLSAGVIALPLVLGIVALPGRLLRRETWLRGIMPFALVVALTSGWWLARAALLDGDPTGSAAFLRLSGLRPRFTITEALWLLLGRLFATRWSETALYVGRVVAGTVLGLAAVELVAAVRRRGAPPAAGSPELGAQLPSSVLAVTAGAILLPFVWANATGLIQAVEGRFVLGMHLPLLALAIRGLDRVVGRRASAVLVGAVIVAAAVDFSYVVHSIRYYYGGAAGVTPAEIIGDIQTRSTAEVALMGATPILAALALVVARCAERRGTASGWPPRLATSSARHARRRDPPQPSSRPGPGS